MTNKTLEALTDEEWDMIETIRENREDDGFRLLIERKHGVWAIELKKRKSAQSRPRHRCRFQSGMGQYDPKLYAERRPDPPTGGSKSDVTP